MIGNNQFTNAWSETEERILIATYPYSENTQQVMLSLLPGRTWYGINHKSCKLGLRRNRLRKRIMRLTSSRGYIPSLDGLIIKDCYFCNKPITRLAGQTKESLVIHHLNHIHTDNRPENRVMAHFSCHSIYHSKGNLSNLGRCHSEATKLKMAEKKREFYRKNPDASRGVNNPMFGRKRPDLVARNKSLEMRQKNSARMKKSNPVRLNSAC